MAAGARLVLFPSVDAAPARNIVNNTDAIAVYAGSDADAIAVAKAQRMGDNNAGWGAASVTAIAAPADMTAWRMHVRVTDTLGVTNTDVRVTGAASATIDSIAALMVTALNAAGPMANASYNSSTNVLTISSAGDALGDHKTIVEFFSPAANVQRDVAVPGFVLSKVDGGVSGAALTATLAADAYALPVVLGSFRQHH